MACLLQKDFEGADFFGEFFEKAGVVFFLSKPGGKGMVFFRDVAAASGAALCNMIELRVFFLSGKFKVARRGIFETFFYF